MCYNISGRLEWLQPPLSTEDKSGGQEEGHDHRSITGGYLG